MMLELTESAAERATAATDALLALAAVAGIVALRRRTSPSFGRAVWQSALAATAVASALGAAAHGLALTDTVRELLWQPLFLALGVTMALFVVGAVRDRAGDRAARRLLPPMLVLALVFYGVTQATGGAFLVFVLYESAALLVALLIYLRLAVEGRSGAAAVAAAFALSLTAGAVIAWAARWRWLEVALILLLAWQVNGMRSWSQAEYYDDVRARVLQRAEIEELAQAVQESGGPVLADEYMGLLPLAGKSLYFQPFEFKELAEAGVWDERGLVEAIERREFPLIVMYVAPNWDSIGGRWTEPLQDAITRNYRRVEVRAYTYVFRPRQ